MAEAGWVVVAGWEVELPCEVLAGEAAVVGRGAGVVDWPVAGGTAEQIRRTTPVACTILLTPTSIEFALRDAVFNWIRCENLQRRKRKVK